MNARKINVAKINGSKIDHGTFIVERFPEYRALLERDRRAYQQGIAIRWTALACTFVFSIWCGIVFGVAL